MVKRKTDTKPAGSAGKKKATEEKHIPKNNPDKDKFDLINKDEESPAAKQINDDTCENKDADTGSSKTSNERKAIDIKEFFEDSRRSLVLKSAISERVKQEPCLLGIDEAGRGPVLGPMVYGTCFCPIKDKDKMASLGFDDSKALTEEKREELLEKLIDQPEMINWMVHVLSPNAISNAMLRRDKYNLNSLSHDTAIGLIQAALDGGAHIREVYVDTVGDPGKYQLKLKAIFPNLDITVAKKADSTYPIVGAASICAKVVRDHVMAQWTCAEKVNIPETGYGSGYPGDEKTKKFLHTSLDPVFGFPSLVRFSWSTASKILDVKCLALEWEDDDDDDTENQATGRAAISSYFSATQPTSASGAPGRHHVYFTDRGLSSVATF